MGWIITVSSRALEEKLEKTRREDGFRFLSLFFHFGPLFFAPLSPPVISLSLSLSSVFFLRSTGAKYLSMNVLLRLFNPREGPHGGSKAQR